MQVTYGLENFTAFDRPLYLALGNFDWTRETGRRPYLIHSYKIGRAHV